MNLTNVVRQFVPEWGIPRCTEKWLDPFTVQVNKKSAHVFLAAAVDLGGTEMKNAFHRRELLGHGMKYLYHFLSDTISNLSYYTIRATRAADGEFNVYILGGAFNQFTLVLTATDTTFLSSSFFTVNMDSNDEFSNLKHYPTVNDPT